MKTKFIEERENYITILGKVAIATISVKFSIRAIIEVLDEDVGSNFLVMISSSNFSFLADLWGWKKQIRE